MKNNIILIGFMGCGKSTVGKKIAKECEMDFLDTDAWIEEREETSISEIFAGKGENYFRELETKCLEVLAEESGQKNHSHVNRKVISVGGGLPIREENRQLLKKLGTVFYLKASEDTIYHRLKTDTTRPLLQGENPKQKIRDLMEAREEKYILASDRVIVVDDKKVKEIVEEIKQELEQKKITIG